MLPLVKIIVTLGPSCQSEEKIQSLAQKGADIFRFNLKHNTLDWHKKRINLVRRIGKKLQKPIGILADIEGGELRTGKFGVESSLALKEGETVVFSEK